MRRALAVLLLVQLLATACGGKISVGGGPEGEGYVEKEKTSGPMVMVTIAVFAAAVVGLMLIAEQNKTRPAAQ